MDKSEHLKETILNEAPRFTENDKFYFSCHKGLSCFTNCCADVTIFLTPYDIIRMKNRLGISSEEFLAKYTFVPFHKEQRFPVVVLKMGDDEGKRCPFVTARGCSIYEDRPWSCRMYPLGLASPRQNASAREERFYFLMQEGDCRGFEEGALRTVSEWLEDQGIRAYDEMGQPFKELTLHDFFRQDGKIDPQKMEMLYLGCYNLDKFRRFVFESRFLDYYELDRDTIERIRGDDVELMKFAVQWLKFALFNEPTIKIREQVLQQKRQKLNVNERPV